MIGLKKIFHIEERNLLNKESRTRYNYIPQNKTIHQPAFFSFFTYLKNKSHFKFEMFFAIPKNISNLKWKLN